VALLSDTHTPGDRLNEYRGFKPWENLQSVVPEVAATEPEWVLINGDAARLAGLPEDYLELRKSLEPLSKQVPIVVGLGNHDDRANFFKEFTDPAGKRPSVRGKHVTVIEHEAIRLVVLDSLLYVNKTAGLLGREQRSWLAMNLARMADRPTALLVHHTLGDGDGDLLDVDRLFDLLKPHRHVQAIFYGHSHVWNRQEREGIQLINLPAVGYNFRDQDPVGWVQAWFHPRGVRLKLRAFAGNRERDDEEVEIEWG
jgi:3',5'-cyclic AMP phosphodiesterase CpdA